MRGRRTLLSLRPLAACPLRAGGASPGTGEPAVEGRPGDRTGPPGGTGVSALGTEGGSVPVGGDGPAAPRPPLGPDRGPGAGCAGAGGRGRDRRAGARGPRDGGGALTAPGRREAGRPGGAAASALGRCPRTSGARSPLVSSPRRLPSGVPAQVRPRSLPGPGCGGSAGVPASVSSGPPVRLGESVSILVGDLRSARRSGTRRRSPSRGPAAPLAGGPGAELGADLTGVSPLPPSSRCSPCSPSWKRRAPSRPPRLRGSV